MTGKPAPPCYRPRLALDKPTRRGQLLKLLEDCEMNKPIPGTVDRVYLDADNPWLMRCVIVDTDETHLWIAVPLETEQSPWAVGDAVMLDASSLDGKWRISA